MRISYSKMLASPAAVTIFPGLWYHAFSQNMKHVVPRHFAVTPVILHGLIFGFHPESSHPGKSKSEYTNHATGILTFVIKR